jgi:small GTP-binding protein
MPEKEDNTYSQDTDDTTELEKRILDDLTAYELEEFYLKVQVDLEDAMSGDGDFLHILEDVYSRTQQTEEKDLEQFKQFGLDSKKKSDQIYLITCFKERSGLPLFEICLTDKSNCQYSLSYILNTVKNYVRVKLGELIEVISLESQTIHFFAIEQEFIIAIVTSKDLPRDKIDSLATQLVTTMHRYSEEEIGENSRFLEEIKGQIDSIQSSFIREHHILKIILIGDGAVGKTSIRRQYLGEGFKNDYQMTIGADLATKESPVLYSGGKQIKYLIWDLAGQPRFENVRTAYYMSAMGALVVFDATRPESFQNIVTWMNEVWRNNGRGPVPMVILGNKTDLRQEGLPSVSDEKAQRFALTLSKIAKKHRGFNIYYLPTSAKTGFNINLAFELLGEAILDFFASMKNKD